MDSSSGHYAQSNKSGEERQILNDLRVKSKEQTQIKRGETYVYPRQ